MPLSILLPKIKEQERSAQDISACTVYIRLSISISELEVFKFKVLVSDIKSTIIDKWAQQAKDK
jgi:hypothetical protein